MTRSRFLSGMTLICTFVLVGLGCGPSVNPGVSGRVSGALTYKGQPIKAAVMNFHSPQGIAYAALVASDGTYAAEDIGIGEMIVTVETESLKKNQAAVSSTSKDFAARMAMNQSSMRRNEGGGGGANSAAPPPPPVDLYIKIPAKYSNPKTSPLTVTLKAGRQVQNIDLTD